MPSRDDIFAAFDRITVWSRGSEREPHMLLLVLYALDQLSRGGPNSISFRELAPKLTELLRFRRQTPISLRFADAYLAPVFTGPFLCPGFPNAFLLHGGIAFVGELTTRNKARRPRDLVRLLAVTEDESGSSEQTLWGLICTAHKSPKLTRKPSRFGRPSAVQRM